VLVAGFKALVLAKEQVPRHVRSAVSPALYALLDVAAGPRELAQLYSALSSVQRAKELAKAVVAEWGSVAKYTG